MEEERQQRALKKAEAFREQHRLDRNGQYYGKCRCGRWEGSINRYGPSSYAVHLLIEFLLSDGTGRD